MFWPWWPRFLQGSQLFLAMPPQQLKISGKHVSLHLPSLKEHIRVFKIISRSKIPELCGHLLTGARTHQRHLHKWLSLSSPLPFLTVSDAELGYPEI
jgi:hypothetical protein